MDGFRAAIYLDVRWLLKCYSLALGQLGFSYRFFPVFKMDPLIFRGTEARMSSVKMAAISPLPFAITLGRMAPFYKALQDNVALFGLW